MSDSTPTGRRTRAGKTSEQKGAKKRAGGRLRIGDNWNVITIIALSQNNPLKANRRVRGEQH
jgi:hypothetical protein